MTTKQYISLRQVSLLKRVVEGMIKNGKTFGFDIESGYSGEDRKGLALLPFHPDWVFAGISFTNTDKGAFYVPIGHDNGDNIDDPLAAIVLLWELLNTGNGVPHNAMFEYIGLSRVFRQFLSDHPVYGEAVRKSKGLFDIRSDTMVEAHMLAKYEPKSAGGGVGVGLKELTKEVFGHQQVEFKELFPEEDSELGPGTKKTKMSYIRFNTRNPNAKAVTDYACEDALWTLGLHETHYPELKDSVLFQIEIKLLRVLAEMEIEGLLLDWDQIHSKTEELAEFRDKMNEEILQQLSEELGEVVSINLASPKQLGELLYDRLGIPEKKDRKTGKRTTSEPALRSLAKENKVVRDILLLREVAKLYGSYLNKYDTELNYDGTGRARPNHRSLGALTGRLSVDGVSYQQWPKPYSYDLSDGTKFTMNFRDLLIAPEDYRIIGFDYSQVELRVMAGLAQEHAMLSAFNSGEDIHKATASAMMGIPLSEVTKKLRSVGKAQPLYEKVLTPFGWTTMGKIGVGDVVVGADGAPVRVHGVFPQGKKKIYKVTLSDGATVDMCDEHLLTVRNRNTKGDEWVTKTLGELMKAGLRQEVAGGKYAQPKYELPARPVIEYANSGKLPIDPYFLGLLLGDGGFRHSWAAYYCTSDPELAEYVRKAATGMGVGIREEVKKDGLTYFFFPSLEKNGINPLTRALKSLGLWNLIGSDKFIPEMYLRASPDDRLAIMQGIMDTDGTPQYSGAYLRMSAEKLVLGVQEIARSLGGNATYSSKQTEIREGSYGKTRKRTHITQVLLQNGLVPFRMSRKISKLKPRKYTNAVRIFDAEYIGDFDAQCISVENEDGLYISNGYSVIHNTINFAITYGSGAENIAEMLTSPDNPVTTEDAEELLKKYYQGFPALTGWMESKKVQGREQKYVETPFGRHFTVWEFIQASQPKNHLFSRKLMSKGDRMCVNAVVQGGAADIIKSSMVKAQHAIKKAGLEDKIRIIMTIHDALEFYVHKSISTQEVIDFLGPLVSPEVPGFPEILAEWHEGRSWGSVVELGLDENGQISDYSYEDENNQKHVFKSLQEAYDHQDLPDEEKIPDDSIREEKVTETPKLIVITLVSEELPSGPQMMSLKNYLQDTPGLSSVRLDTSQGNFDLPEKVSSETLDKAQISVTLGGAKVSVLDTAELSLEDIDLD